MRFNGAGFAFRRLTQTGCVGRFWMGLLYYPSDQPQPNCKTRATIALFCHKVKHVSYKSWKGNISLVARSLTPGRVGGVNSVPHACRSAGRWTCPSFEGKQKEKPSEGVPHFETHRLMKRPKGKPLPHPACSKQRIQSTITAVDATKKPSL